MSEENTPDQEVKPAPRGGAKAEKIRTLIAHSRQVHGLDPKYLGEGHWREVYDKLPGCGSIRLARKQLGVLQRICKKGKLEAKKRLARADQELGIVVEDES